MATQTEFPRAEDPRLFINRELSLLAFNRRVLEQAREAGLPILERLRFLSICSTNLDEFFEVRVAGLKQQEAFGVQKPGPDGLAPREALRVISETAHELVAEQYEALNEDLLPALSAEGIRLPKRAHWTPDQTLWMKGLFRDQIRPVLTPVGIDPAHPFPRVPNKSLNFIVSVEGKDAFGRDSGVAVVQVPRSLPRVYELPEEVTRDDSQDIVLLSSIVHAHVGELFPGMEVTGCYQFRVTRNSDLWVDEEEVDNLLLALKGELPSRRYGEAVRLEVADNCTEEMATFLLRNVGLGEEDLYRVRGPVNMHRLVGVYDLIDRPELKYPRFTPGLPPRLARSHDLFETIRQGDILLHHPFESFTPVVQLVKQAAADPDVLAIKQTVYRTSARSPLIEALIDAARQGKEVTAVVELRARFDEAANIDLATRLEEVGANVVYGVVGFKTHAKMLLIVRREGTELRSYVHLGTGNYHPGTARAYTDFGLLTSDPELCEDAQRVFQQLTGLGTVAPLAKAIQSPFTLHTTLLDLIEKEIQHAEAGRPAKIVAKMNSLSERAIIEALYAASQAGVTIELIIRGICCLRPGVPGISDNIRVRSVLGRFLEHARVYYFLDGGKEVLYCSSADWMSRNLHRRIEVAYPVEDPILKRRVIQETLELYLADDLRSWILGSDGVYRRQSPSGAGLSAQAVLSSTLGDSLRERPDSPTYDEFLTEVEEEMRLNAPTDEDPSTRDMAG